MQVGMNEDLGDLAGVTDVIVNKNPGVTMQVGKNEDLGDLARVTDEIVNKNLGDHASGSERGLGWPSKSDWCDCE